MPDILIDDFIDAAEFVEEEFNISLHKDILFNNELNAYFNYKFCEKENKMIFKIEVDEGGAEFYVTDWFDEDDKFEIEYNSVAAAYLDRTSLVPIEGLQISE